MPLEDVAAPKSVPLAEAVELEADRARQEEAAARRRAEEQSLAERAPFGPAWCGTA